MECLDTETLCMHMDHELATQMHREVTAHLSTCPSCTEKLRSLQSHDALVRNASSQPHAVVAPSTSSCHSAEALSIYSRGLFPNAELALFEQHLFACDQCLGEVMSIRRMQRLLHAETLLTPPAHLRAAVQARATSSPQSLGARLGTLIIQVATDGLRFLEALLVPEDVQVAIGGRLVPAGAFRSTTADTAALVDIRQTRQDFELHVQALHEAGTTVLLKVHLQKHGAPLARVRVTLVAAGHTLASRPTSGGGEVEFPRLAPGEYTLKIAQERLETQLILQTVGS